MQNGWWRYSLVVTLGPSGSTSTAEVFTPICCRGNALLHRSIRLHQHIGGYVHAPGHSEHNCELCHSEHSCEQCFTGTRGRSAPRRGRDCGIHLRFAGQSQKNLLPERVIPATCLSAWLSALRPTQRLASLDRGSGKSRIAASGLSRRSARPE